MAVPRLDSSMRLWKRKPSLASAAHAVADAVTISGVAMKGRRRARNSAKVENVAPRSAYS
jgi:hypothetical protein